MKLKTWRLSLAVFLLCNAVFARDHVNLSGPAVMLGYGTFFGGGTGVNLEYQIRKSDKEYTFTPFLGTGEAYSAGRWLPGANVGCLLEYGSAHRAFIGVSYGMINEMHEDRGEGTVYFHTERWMEVGSSIYAGYRGMIPFGLCWLASINIGIIDNSLNTNRMETAIPGFSLAVGYKI